MLSINIATIHVQPYVVEFVISNLHRRTREIKNLPKLTQLTSVRARIGNQDSKPILADSKAEYTVKTSKAHVNFLNSDPVENFVFTIMPFFSIDLCDLSLKTSTKIFSFEEVPDPWTNSLHRFFGPNGHQSA